VKLTDARGEAGRIIEEARQGAEALRVDLVARAEADAQAIRARASDDVQALTARALADLQGRVADLSIELAEKVVERNLDHDTQVALIENYINSVGTSGG
jgi:F-type H+-transporting ATPase subunit b